VRVRDSANCVQIRMILVMFDIRYIYGTWALVLVYILYKTCTPTEPECVEGILGSEIGLQCCTICRYSLDVNIPELRMR